LIALGVCFACGLIHILSILASEHIRVITAVITQHPSFVLLLVVASEFLIAGGILCLMRKHWRACLASAWFAVLFVVFNIVYFSGLSPFLLGWPWRNYIYIGWPTWFMLVAAVISVVFVLRMKKEWKEIWDSVDGKVSYDG